MDPTELMAWVNEYMDAMTQVIEAHGGFVDDYSGDGIKANFGVPFARATAGAGDAGRARRRALRAGDGPRARAAVRALARRGAARGA